MDGRHGAEEGQILRVRRLEKALVLSVSMLVLLIPGIVLFLSYGTSQVAWRVYCASGRALAKGFVVVGPGFTRVLNCAVLAPTAALWRRAGRRSLPAMCLWLSFMELKFCRS